MLLLRLVKAVTPESLFTRLMDRELERLAEDNAKLSRQLGAELAENARLVDLLADVHKRISGPCMCADLPAAVASWQRQASQDRLAVAEGRPVVGSLS